MDGYLGALGGDLNLEYGFGGIALSRLFLRKSYVLGLFRGRNCCVVGRIRNFVVSLVLGLARRSRFEGEFFGDVLGGVASTTTETRRSLLSEAHRAVLSGAVSSGVLGNG